MSELTRFLGWALLILLVSTPVTIGVAEVYKEILPLFWYNRAHTIAKAESVLLFLGSIWYVLELYQDHRRSIIISDNENSARRKRQISRRVGRVIKKNRKNIKGALINEG